MNKVTNIMTEAPTIYEPEMDIPKQARPNQLNQRKANNMSEFLQFPSSLGSAMKAMILYDDFALAVRANTAIQRSARRANSDTHCDTRPWRLEMLKFAPTAEEALTDALDAHLLVIAGRCAQSPPAWLQCWLEHWAKCRQIKAAALALFGVCWNEGFADSAIRKFAEIATRHGLGLIYNGGQNQEDQSNIREHFRAEPGPLPYAGLQLSVNAQICRPHPG